MQVVFQIACLWSVGVGNYFVDSCLYMLYTCQNLSHNGPFVKDQWSHHVSFMQCNNPLVKDHATMGPFPKGHIPKHNPHPTQHFWATQVLSCAHAVEPTFFTIVYSFSRGFHSIKRTHAIVHKGSCLHFVKVHIFLFYKYHTQYRLCFRNTTFFTKVLLCCLFTH